VPAASPTPTISLFRLSHRPGTQKFDSKIFFAVLRILIHLIRIRIQHFRLNTDPEPDPIRIQGFDDQKLLQVTKEAFISQKRTSSTSKHEFA
jgi:hypothetical protein